MPWVFAYGSLMFPEVTGIVLGREMKHHAFRDATLDGFRRAAIPGRVYPTAVALPGSRIHGKLMGPLPEREILMLDAYEESFYERVPVTVVTSDGRQEAFAYIDRRHPLPFELREWDPDHFRREHLGAFVHRLRMRRAPAGAEASCS